MTCIFSFDSEFCSLFCCQNPIYLTITFYASLKVQEIYILEKEKNSGSLACEEDANNKEGYDFYLNDNELVIAPLDPYGKFHEDPKMKKGLSSFDYTDH